MCCYRLLHAFHVCSAEVSKKKAKKVKHEAQMGSEGADGMALVRDRAHIRA